MQDTTPEMERVWREMLMARSGEERFLMGLQMFDDARAIVIASLPANLPLPELKRRLYQRFYGQELPVEGLHTLKHLSHENGFLSGAEEARSVPRKPLDK